MGLLKRFGLAGLLFVLLFQAGFGLFIFWGLWAGGGYIVLYEGNSTIRVVELVLATLALVGGCVVFVWVFKRLFLPVRGRA